MCRNSINALVIGAACLCLSGCATDKERMLPAGDKDMMTVWHQQTNGGSGSQANRRLLDARLSLRRADIEQTDLRVWSRENLNEHGTQFQRLPNPDLVMYVFPHLAGGAAPIPGYSTVFPMYGSVQYAMPGERTRDDEK
jgi:conjugative transfer region lipoprotein (TIGR03751 family)